MMSLLLVSIAVGLLGSLTGLGGASILTPILVLLGIPVKEAVACGMVGHHSYIQWVSFIVCQTKNNKHQNSYVS